MAIYLPQQKSFMDQFLGTGIMSNVMQAMMMRMQNQREDSATARGYQEQGYTEVSPMTPSEEGQLKPAEEQSAYAARKPDLTVGGGRGLMSTPQRGFKRPVEPKLSYKAVKDKETGRPFLEIYKDGKLNKVSAMSQAANDIKKTGWQRKIDYFKGKNGKSMAQVKYFNSDPKDPKEMKVGKPYEVMRGTGGGGASIQLVGFDEKDPAGKRPITYNPKTGKVGIGKPVTGLGDVTRKTTNLEQINKDISKAKQKIENDPTNPATKAEIEYLQKTDNSDTVYVWKTKPRFTIAGKGFGSESKAEAVKLPVLNGKQVTTQHIRDTMKEEGVTFDEVLERILNEKPL